MFANVVMGEGVGVGAASRPAGVASHGHDLSKALVDQGFSLDDAHLTMLTLEGDYPEWFAIHENTLAEPILCDRKELLDALASAPNTFLAGMIYQALVMRAQMSFLSGREDR